MVTAQPRILWIAIVTDGTVETVSNSVGAVLSMGGIMTIVSAMLFPVVWAD